MPASLDTLRAEKQRRQDLEVVARKRIKTTAGSNNICDRESEILLLEGKIFESRQNYNDINILLVYAQEAGVDNEADVFAAVALCRVFSRLMAAGNLTKSKDLSENESTIVRWLLEKYKGFRAILIQHLRGNDTSRQNVALTLLMRLLKEEDKYLNLSGHELWCSSIFAEVIEALVTSSTAKMVGNTFVGQYAEKYDDVRYYLFANIGDMFSGEASETQVHSALSMLAAVHQTPDEAKGFPNCFLTPPSKTKKGQGLYSRAAYMKQIQRAWMGIIRQKLAKTQRKRILEMMSAQIAPSFLKIELLLDFLTDSFNVGGSTSLMALSGLFYLIQHKNLDYPQFYLKLYSLLDDNILHSKHRSRFFRLLDTFLGSTHLPGALVASFIKRLSRLCLYAPPSGVVVVVPWIYNLLKGHPTCTLMIHRTPELSERDEHEQWDPFRMEEADPMETDAIESSLWEIETLQSHYHPNVATIAKIIAEQFTKHAYNIEDFLDHSYATMLDAELSKDIKKAPEIEYDIPKKIFSKHDTDSCKDDSLLVRLWDFK
ncbi:MAG: hypothetical protein Q9217_003386 [Psora testacea]